jgi:hypothetical protein
MKVTIAFSLSNAVDVQRSTAVELPEWARHASIELPATIVTGTVGFEFIKEALVTAALLAPTNNTSWGAVQVAIDSVANLTSCHDGTGGGAVIDVSKFIAGLGKGHIRVITGGTQDAVTSWFFHFTD